jgi:uncharacterized membrane protein
LWVVPTVLCVAAVALFAVTYAVDRLSFDRGVHLPSLLSQSSPDAARTVLGAAAGALITVTGVVFSVMIVAFTLASQQFGPRMLRNFIRDLGTQFSLGVFVASFVYTVLTLGSVGASANVTFVPRLSMAVAELSLLVDTAVLNRATDKIRQAGAAMPAVAADMFGVIPEWVTQCHATNMPLASISTSALLRVDVIADVHAQIVGLQGSPPTCTTALPMIRVVRSCRLGPLDAHPIKARPWRLVRSLSRGNWCVPFAHRNGGNDHGRSDCDGP